MDEAHAVTSIPIADKISDEPQTPPTPVLPSAPSHELQTQVEDPQSPFYQTVSCSICTISKENGMKLSCGHIFCHACLKEYVRMKIFTGGVLDITCMDIHCRLPFSDDDIERIVEEDAFLKYKDFKFSASHILDTNTRWCPVPDCNTLVSKKDRSSRMTCSKCCTDFCFDCNEKWHPTVTCSEYMKELKKMKKIDVKSEKLKQTAGRKCPGCSIIIQRKEGCNHVICSYCKYEFCWICMKEFRADHYFVGDCEGLQFAKFPKLKKVGRKAAVGGKYALYGAGIGLGAVLAVGLAVPVAVIALPVYGIYYVAKKK
eukprot:TRINITY_DN2731_c0_g1_i1.p1 TRINITY_DN2731_c0_g1~~TRINITY_DN2731_c0_g1_i1.p1  ORF type:complete len:314 (+),score=37.60 TRINITY_DN2731_c0_g1_i1:86-1027(+)